MSSQPRRWAPQLLTGARRMTDGEKWTAGLALAVAVSFLAYGQQQPVKDDSIQLGLARPSGSLVAPDDPVPAPVVVPPSVVQPAPQPGPAAVPVVVTTPESSSPVIAPVTEPLTLPVRPKVVALVRPADSATNVDDGAIAAAFLPDVGVPVKVVKLDPAASTLCADALAAGNLVVAGQGLPAGLRSCLLAGGATVLSYDSAGSAGRAVSTRLGAARALVVAAALADRSTPVGLAVSTEFAGQAKVAQSLLARQGRKVLVAVVPTGSTNAPDYLTAIQGFSSAGVTSVVFGMPQNDQSTWSTVEVGALFRPVHIVADVADAFLSESYLPLFDGALGVAATRVPWFERDHQASPGQTACRARYEKASGTAVAGTTELADVYLWCQHAQILRSALAQKTELQAALRSLVVDSPMTSPLRSSTAGFGPSQVAVLSWGAACACWTEKTPFKATP